MCFGEHNQDRKLSGRGVRIDKFGVIFAGYYENGNDAPGRFIEVRDDGSLFLGEWYLGPDGNDLKGTLYKTDGTTEDF